MTIESILATPLGPLRVQLSARGIRGLWFRGQRHEPASCEAGSAPASALLDELGAWLEGCFAGSGQPVPDWPYDLEGTALQTQVWQALREIPPGSTCSYRELAVAVGRPSAVRAVAACVARNPCSIVIPCHRILGASGALTGYAGGLGRKRALLDLEAGRGLPWRPARQDHRARPGEPLIAEIGAELRWQAHPEEGQHPGWRHAIDAAGRSGWVPTDWLRSHPDGRSAVALRHYEARELEVKQGEKLLALDAHAGWTWAIDRQGRCGWVPERL